MKMRIHREKYHLIEGITTRWSFYLEEYKWSMLFSLITDVFKTITFVAFNNA